MKIVRSRTGWFSGLLAGAVVFATAASASAQTTKMPSTLRYGSGLLDTPVASVIPHLAIVGTYSGFWNTSDIELDTNARGEVVGIRERADDSEFFGDGSVYLGLFDRVELGVSLQSFNDSDEGGNIVGGFGRVAILRPEQQGIGLAVGGRFVSAPEFDVAGVDFQPTRLGFPDERFRKDLPDDADGFLDDDDINTEFTGYAVASAFLRGLDKSFLPKHDFTFSLGWGQGMFSEGENQNFYSFTDSEGFFGGAAVHMALGDAALLNLMGEWNGFDVNLGAQVDFGGIRVGGHLLGANYLEDAGIYRSQKWGILGSVALCPTGGFLCETGLMEREAPDTVQLPAPPPDTVTVTREVAPPLPTGTPTQICLATGESAEVMVTAAGDTLVGPGRISISTLRPGVVFAGSYAAGETWFEQDEAITYDEREYLKSGGPVRLDCASIVRIGEHMGVPLYAMRNADEPYEMIYVPARPGVWQPYETDLRATRGF